MAQGLWNIGGFNLPDLGISEALGLDRVGIPNNAAVYPKGQVFGASDSANQYLNQNYGGNTAGLPYGPANPATGKIGGTTAPSNPAPTGGGGDNRLTQLSKADRNPIQEDEYQRLLREAQNSASAQEQRARDAINSGYDAYFGELDNILNSGLGEQRTAQENIAQSQYNQGLNTLTSQRDTSLTDLGNERTKTEGRQNKTLKDIAENLRNSFLAGSVYLGSKGAGDSSAANQYSYALTKLGSKQRGDVNAQYADIFGDIGNREFKVKQVFDTESKNLQETLNQQVNSIAQWFGEQQNALRQAKAQGQLSRGQDLAQLSQNLLNVALQQLSSVQGQIAQRRSALEQWAMNNSTNVNQLASNMGAISGAAFAPAPNAQPLVGTPQIASNGSFFAPTGFGGGGSDTDIFGRRIR